MTPEQIDTAAKHFIIAAIWADCPEGTHPRATKAAEQWAHAFVSRFAQTHPDLCAAVLECEDYGWIDGSRQPAAAFGHDLYLTSCGHGVGFWDRGIGEPGDKISDAIRAEFREWHCEPEFYRGWLYF